MSQLERSGDRNGDLLYSSWHRAVSIRRFIPAEDADVMTMINIDALLRCERWVETCRSCYRPLAIIETAWDNHQTYKTAAATRGLAVAAGCAGLITLITPNATRSDINSFRVRYVAPKLTDWKTFTPEEYARLLVRIRGRWHSGCEL